MTESSKVFKASRLPKQIGISAWVAMLPKRVERPALANAEKADVVIIGAGFAGLSAARRISELDPKLRVIILEAGVIGEGAAGRNSGFIIDLPHEVSSEDYGGDSSRKAKEDIIRSRRAIALATEVAMERGWGREIFDPCGRYSVAISEEGDRHLVSYAEQLKKIDEPYRLLNGSQIADITGTKAYASALFTPGTVMVQPAAYIRGLADSLHEPVEIFERSPVLSFETAGQGWLVRTPKGSVGTAKIILANNGHAESFGFFRGKLLHVFTFASITEEFNPGRLPGDRKWAATPALPMGTTVRRVPGAAGDRILIRSRYTYHPGQVAGEGTLVRAGAQHDKKFLARFPGLKDIKMEYRWGGPMAVTLNSVPAFGEVERNVFSACGCNGVGASNATAAGIAAAETVLGHTSELTEIFSRYDVPKSLPPQPFITIGAKAVLTFREWKAGAE
ncbi:NAD(P)/FAD-dependent oxidoreductase [Rhizobium jaguaris]|nr:FAD-binding oxidoreductase [Rhizobium jaguaris]